MRHQHWGTKVETVGSRQRGNTRVRGKMAGPATLPGEKGTALEGCQEEESIPLRSGKMTRSPDGWALSGIFEEGTTWAKVQAEGIS